MDPERDQFIVEEEIASEVTGAASENGPDGSDVSIEAWRSRGDGDGWETLEAVHEGISELSNGGERERAIIERPIESLDADADYLQFLGEIDQDFIDRELYEKGRVTHNNVAILSLDIEGYSAMANEEMKRHADGGYGASRAAEQVALRLAPVSEEIRSVAKLFGGRRDQFWGDGINIMFGGEDAPGNVSRAVETARLLQKNIGVTGLKVRAGIDVGRVDLVAYGGEIKRADMTGEAVERAEAIQRSANEANHFIAISTDAQAALEGRFSHENGHAVEGHGWEEQLPVVTTEAEPDSARETAELVRVREAFLSSSYARDLRHAFLGQLPDQSFQPVSTLFVRLKNLDTYERRNRAMAQVFEMMTNYRGKVDKVRGDVVMINFVAWLNDANAVKAGQRLAEQLRNKGQDFDMGLGRASSLVLSVGGLPTVTGEGVIRARRLLDTENPHNQLVVDGPTWDRVREINVQTQELKPVKAKGFDEPVARFAVKEVGLETAGPHGRELVYRDKELEALQNDFERARSEKIVRVIVGGKGLGKSALVGEFANRKREVGAQVILAKAEIYNQNQPFLVWRDMLEGRLHLADLRGEKRAQSVHAFLAENLPELADEVALLNPILGTRFEESDRIKYLEGPERDERRAEFLARMLEMISRAGTEDQGMIVFEDLQFFDEESEKLLANVINKTRTPGMFLLTSWTQDIDGEETMPRAQFLHQVGMEVETTELGGLPVLEMDYEQARKSGELEVWWEKNGKVWFDVLASFIDLDRNDLETNPAGYKRIITKLSQKTGGNLLYVGSALYHLTVYQGDKDGYFIQNESGKYLLGSQRIQDEAFLAIPDIEKIQQDRLELVDVETRNLLRDAAVDGVVFDVGVLAYVSGMPSAAIERKLQNTLGKGIVSEVGGGRYRFVDPSMANAVYNSIGRSQEKRKKHRMYGEYYERANPDDLPLLVRHFRNSDNYLKALNYLDDYVGSLRADSLWGPAINHTEYATRVFKQVRENDWQVPDLHRDGVSRTLAKREIHQLIHGQITRWMNAAPDVRIAASDWNAVRQLIQDARGLFVETHNREAVGLDDQLVLLNLHLEAAKVDKSLADHRKMQRELSVAERMMGSLSSQLVTGEQRAAYNHSRYDFLRLKGGLAYSEGQYERSLKYQQEALTYASTIRSEIATLLAQANCYQYMGDIQQAQNVYEETLERAETTRDLAALSEVLNRFGELKARIGALDDAEGMYRRAMSVSSTIGKTSALYYATGQLAFVERIRGNFTEAEVLFGSAAEFFEGKGKTVMANVARVERIFCLIKIGEFAKAESELEYLSEQKIDEEAKAQTVVLGAMLQMERSRKISDTLISRYLYGVEMLREAGQETSVAFALMSLAELEIEYGDARTALLHLAEARRIYEETGEVVALDKIDQLLAKADLSA